MIPFIKKYIYIGCLAIFSVATMNAQVKIGDNHQTINPGSLLELESSNKGLMFTRIALNNDLTVWTLNGGVAMDGMVVFNTNSTVNSEGLYCWYNSQWNHLTAGGTGTELDTLSFNVDTRMLYDDGDSVEIPSGRVAVVDSVGVLQQNVTNVSEGDIFYVTGSGLYIRNNDTTATTITDGYIFVPAMPKPGKILYANYDAVQLSYDGKDFDLGVADSFYNEPGKPNIINVPTPSNAGNKGIYAFAVPSDWANPRIYLKVKNSADRGFYKLDNCWTVTREMEYDGMLYQVWTLDVPMRESVMDIVNSKAQFMIE